MNNDELYGRLGKRIREVRKARRMTQACLAHRIRLSRASVVNIEKGRQMISAWQLCQMGAALGVPPHLWLLPEADFQEQKPLPSHWRRMETRYALT